MPVEHFPLVEKPPRASPIPHDPSVRFDRGPSAQTWKALHDPAVRLAKAACPDPCPTSPALHPRAAAKVAVPDRPQVTTTACKQPRPRELALGSRSAPGH